MKVFEVRGSGSFPTDMLRYDECFPSSERESAIIDASGKRVVTLCTDNKHAPTAGRWKIFGWNVVYQDSAEEKPVKDQYKDLIEYAMKKGHGIQLQDPDWKESEDETRVYTGASASIIRFVQSEVYGWDGGQDFHIIINNPELDIPNTGRPIWVGLAIGYGNQPWEQVYDYSVHPFMEEWSKQYSEKYQDE